MAFGLYRSLAVLQTLFKREFKKFKTFNSFKPSDDFGLVLNGLNALLEGVAQSAAIGYGL
jgi:hypothetical protein